MARPTEDKVIDLRCIAIGTDKGIGGISIDGRVNGSSRDKQNSQGIRCPDNNENLDGFVYTSSTYTDDNGETYKYNYVINSDSGIYADIIKGADADDPHRAANSIRSNKKNEGIINMKNSLNNRQFNGRSTKTEDFVYNEGYSKTLGNAENNKIGISFNGGGTYTVTAEDGTTFYDTQTAVYSNQLIAVRQLK